MIKRLFFIVGILLNLILSAQSIRVEGIGPGVVRLGEQFSVNYSINGNPSSFNLPATTDFNLLAGPNTSSSSSVQIINGKMSQSVEIGYSYIFQAIKVGKFTIGQAKAVVDGKTYASNAVQIEVINSANQPAQTQSQQNQSQQTTAPDFNNEDLFLRVIVNKSNVYKGDPVSATIKVFTRIELVGIEKVELPNFNGFYQQPIETPQLSSLTRENVNGQIYNTGVIQNVLLFPQKDGKIVINAAEIQCVIRKKVARQARSVFDDFFGAGYQDVRVKVSSNPVTINVKPLSGAVPASFNGAVGKFNFSASIDKNSVKSNDAITLKVAISGSGNLKLLEAPKINFPSDFEVYNPELKTEINNTLAGSSGKKSYEYIMIPRHAGSFTIPAVEFAYFDLVTGKYVVKKSTNFQIEVAKGPDDASGAVITSASKVDIKVLGKDIRYIKRETKLKKNGEYFLGSLLFWLGLLVPSFIFIVVVLWRRKSISENANKVATRNRKASMVVKNRFKLVRKLLKQGAREKFFEELSRALWGYISDKLSISMADLSKDSATIILKEKGVSDERIYSLWSVIDTCEFARYAPGSIQDDLSTILKNAEDIVFLMEDNIR